MIEKRIVKMENSIRIFDKILNIAESETKTRLFQVKTNVDFRRGRQVFEITGPLPIGYYGLTEMEDTAIMFEVIDSDTVRITDVQPGKGNITIYPEIRGEMSPTLLSVDQNKLAGTRRTAKYKPFAPAFALTPHGGLVETRTVTICCLPLGKYKIGKTFP